MKLTKSKLKQIIQEELKAVLSEGAIPITDTGPGGSRTQKAEKLCKKGYKAACHALEWVKKCEEERRNDPDPTGDNATGRGPACQKSYKLLKSYVPQQYGFGDD